MKLILLSVIILSVMIDKTIQLTVKNTVKAGYFPPFTQDQVFLDGLSKQHKSASLIASLQNYKDGFADIVIKNISKRKLQIGVKLQTLDPPKTQGYVSLRSYTTPKGDLNEIVPDNPLLISSNESIHIRIDNVHPKNFHYLGIQFKKVDDGTIGFLETENWIMFKI